MSIRSLIKRLSFNERLRDLWVSERASMVPKGSILLDVGAGSSPYRELFSHCEYRSQDFSKLKPNQLRGNQVYAELDYVCDICEIPVPNESFDVALCTEVLEHVPNPIQAVKEIGRILKPGGELILTAPLGSGLHQEPYHFYGGYTPHWYRKFLDEAGFGEIEISPNRGSYSHYGQECLRFLLMMSPWKSRFNWVWFPLWLIGIPWCFCIAFFGKSLDKLDKNNEFTIGYHVTAVKRENFSV